jgi:hypothetical protein
MIVKSTYSYFGHLTKIILFVWIDFWPESDVVSLMLEIAYTSVHSTKRTLGSDSMFQCTLNANCIIIVLSISGVKMTLAYKKAFLLILCLLVFDCKSDISRTKVVKMARLLCTGQDICSVNNSQTDTFENASVCCSGMYFVFFCPTWFTYNMTLCDVWE